MANYRRIWEKHNGPIPKDQQGRSYDIHHIDGDHSNNDISNLTALSRRDHYETHKKQGDWFACLILSETLNLTKEEIDEISRRTTEAIKDKLKGVPKTEEHRRKLSEAKRGKPSNRKGEKHSEASKSKMRESHLGEKRGSMSHEHREKIRASLKGRTLTDEQKNRISVTLKNKDRSGRRTQR